METMLYTCQPTGVLSCYEAATGEQCYKERLGPGGDGFTASPVASEGRIYFASEEGSVYVVKPGANFTVMATNEMGEVCMATPADFGGRHLLSHARARGGGRGPEMISAEFKLRGKS